MLASKTENQNIRPTRSHVGRYFLGGIFLGNALSGILGSDISRTILFLQTLLSICISLENRE